MAFLSKQRDSSSWRCVRRIEFTADNAKLDQILPHMNRVVGWKFGWVILTDQTRDWKRPTFVRKIVEHKVTSAGEMVVFN